MRTILVAVAVLLCQQSAFAQTSQRITVEDAGIQAALDVRDQFITSVQHKDFTTITHTALGAAIEILAFELRYRYNENAAADAILNEWSKQNPTAFAALVMSRGYDRDLGDHTPLLPWLQNEIQTMTSKYGINFAALPIVSDVVTLNFAIPVVFAPHGSWESPDVDNRIEYRKHFIPFANLVTYYATNLSCNLVLKHYNLSDLKRICPKAANALEWVMGRYIAPQVSDWIFKGANKSLYVSQDQLVYHDVSDIRSAIQE